MIVNDKRQAQCQGNEFDFSDLKVIILNCTLELSAETFHIIDWVYERS
ncbi:MAG: hypothetical protein ACI909_003150 [Planctomycetota bacterium]|jgi:hypothetical protein